MVKYHAIQPLAFRINGKKSDLKQKLWTLQVPEAWYSMLTALHQVVKKNAKPGKMRLPTRDLTMALHLVGPDIVFFEPNSWTSGRAQWLLSFEKVDREAIRHITAAWVESNYGTSKAVSEVISKLKPEDLSWAPEVVDFSAWSLEPNGTALARDSFFRALPQFIGARLSSGGVSLEAPWGRLQFIRVSQPGKDSEIVSWPPLQVGRWRFSYALSFSVHTIPFEAEPIIKCHARIRRWVSEKLTGNTGYQALSYDEQSTLYIRTEEAWLTGVPRPRGFSTARITLVRENGQLQPDYSGNIVPILRRVGIEPRFPTAAELCHEPLRYLDHGNSAVAVVHSNRLAVNHRVTHGVPLPDRQCLFERAAELLESYGLCPVQTLKRVSLPKSGASVLTKPFKEVDKNCLRSRLAQCAGKDLLIEVFYQPGTFPSIVRKTIEEELGLERSNKSNGDIYRYETAELNVAVKERPLGPLGAALAVDGRLARGNERRKAITHRIQEIQKEIQSVSGSTVAFVELADESKDKPYDPKRAVRRGLARTGRLSQFMTPDDTDDEESAGVQPTRSGRALHARARSAVRDGLRQLGYLHGSPGAEAARGLGLSQPLEIMGMWYLTVSGGYLPLAVHIDGPGRIWLKHLGERLWLSYSEGLLKLAGGQNSVLQKRIQREECQTFFKHTIEEIARDRPLLVVVSAENASRYWKWITNKWVARDKVQWQDSGGLSTVKNLRIARIRTVEGTPQWYAEENGSLGVPAALFRKSERVYFGIQSTSVALQVTRAARCSSKVEQPKARVAIPRAQEIFLPVLQPGDDPQALALFVHRTRRMAPQYDGPLKLPVPLHLASQVEEYVEVQ